MPAHVAAFRQRVLRHTVCAERPERSVTNLVAALLFRSAQESEIILKMFDHIQNENQLKDERPSRL